MTERKVVRIPLGDYTYTDEHGETWTLDFGGPTPSASANVAISILSTLPATHERDVLIEAQKYMGNLDVKAPQRLEAMLADPAATTSHEFDRSLSPATIHQFAKSELAARSQTETAKEENWKFWGGMVLTFALGLLGGWLLK